MSDETRPFKLEAGRWGGTGINLQVEGESAAVELHSGEAVIRGPFTVDDQGRFDLPGEYRRRFPGPARESNASRSARFSGRVTGDSMNLKIVLTDTDETAGEFVLERGQHRRVIRSL